MKFSTDYTISAVFCAFTALLFTIFIIGVALMEAGVNEECPEQFNGSDCLEDGPCAGTGDDTSCTCGMPEPNVFLCVAPRSAEGVAFTSFGSMFVLTFLCGALPYFVYGLKYENGTQFKGSKVLFTIVAAIAIFTGLISSIGGTLVRVGDTDEQQLVGLALVIVASVICCIDSLCCYTPLFVVSYSAVEEAEE
eukprot:TRINITY_DN42849_c0_g1_i1.p1 TRINITY_DN42849_c0_g1~~TRINITY_DN42849_c0_g1_i1.p1  ORF type:complete len:193 (+),score=16.07 TRINITY_DN42849_c0_g1_i1:47-625(+)